MSLDNFKKAKSLFDEGIEYSKQSNYILAEKKFLDSLNLLPERLSIVGNLFTIYFNTNKNLQLKNLLSKYEKFSNEKEIIYGKAINFYFEKKYSDSIKLCKKLINIEEIQEFILDLLAFNYQNLNLFLESLNAFKKRLKIKRDKIAYYNLGNFFYEIGKPRQSFYYYKKSDLYNNKDKSNLWNLSLCALTLEKLELGFSLYENRWFKRTDPIRKKFIEIKSPLNVKEIENKNILISDEQGLGDTIQFSRFVIDLLNYTTKITFVVNSKLLELFSNLHKNINVVDYSNLKLNNYEYHISVCSLPNLLNIKKKSDINFYKLSIKEKSEDIINNKKNINVGICWSGNTNYPRDKYRSINFGKVKEFILKNRDVNFYKLSRDIKENNQIDYNPLPNLTDLGRRNFFEISQLLNKFDLVVSSDTSIIHLAGILNIKCILLLNYNSDWRWFSDSKKTIWYPSITIIKQKKINNWDNVFEELDQILQEKKRQRC